MAITYNNLTMDIRQELRLAGVEQFTLEAKELVAFASGKTKDRLIQDSQLYVPQEIEAKVHELVKRHIEGEPVAYIVGEWEFYGLPFDVSKDVLIPRVDTEVLCEKAITYIQTQQEVKVLDLCCGSGCIGVAIASKCPNAHVVMGDKSEEALRIARQNIRRNNLMGEIIPYQIDALEKPPRHIGEFDIVVCNPPYIPSGEIQMLDTSVKDYEPRMALDGGEDGLDFYRSFANNWTGILHHGSMVFFEVGIGQADAVIRILRQVGFGDLEITQDTGNISRVISGKLWEKI